MQFRYRTASVSGIVYPPEAEPNVKLSHPERGNERLGKVFAGRGSVGQGLPQAG